MNRRDFLALSAASAASRGATPAWAATAEGGPSRLVVVMLRGAVDGLNVVVPYGDQAYYDMRPSIAIAKPGGDGGVLALDGHFRLHAARRTRRGRISTRSCLSRPARPESG